MKPRSLPTIDARYWTAILAASMCGANTGDFVSRILGLGHTRGLLPLGLIFLAIVWAETRSKLPTEAYYWLAIIVLRTGATNLADLGTHDLEETPLGLAYGSALLVAALFGIWFISDQYGKMTKPWYWLTIVAARTAGTTLGDLLARRRGLGLGLWVSTICTSLLLAGIVILFRHGRAERLREA